MLTTRYKLVQVARKYTNEVSVGQSAGEEYREKQQDPRQVICCEIKDAKHVHQHERISLGPNIHEHVRERRSKEGHMKNGRYGLNKLQQSKLTKITDMPKTIRHKNSIDLP